MEKNELQKSSSQLPTMEQPQQVGIHMEQSGEGEQIGYVEHYEANNTIQVVIPVSHTGRRGMGQQVITMNTDCYNLFVVEGEMYENTTGTFTIDTSLALTESIDDDLKAKYARLDEEAQLAVRAFPAIFASKNHHYGYTDADHYAAYGIVMNIERDGHQLIISYFILSDVPQQVLNEMATELDLKRAAQYNELNDPHWTIKKANLIALLKSRGINVATIS